MGPNIRFLDSIFVIQNTLFLYNLLPKINIATRSSEQSILMLLISNFRKNEEIMTHENICADEQF